MTDRGWNVRRGRRLCVQIVKAIDASYTIDWRAPKRGPWANRRTLTWAGDGRMRVSEIDMVRALHDIAHLMIASPKRRLLPEFGLGPDPANDQGVRRIVPEHFADREEGRTCDLQWCLAAYLEGVAGIVEVEDYVNTDALSPREIRTIGRRHAALLPPDFTEQVLAARLQYLGEPL